MMTFKDWFYKEAMTSTASIAGFARMTIPSIQRRVWPYVDSRDGARYRNGKIVEQPQIREHDEDRDILGDV